MSYVVVYANNHFCVASHTNVVINIMQPHCAIVPLCHCSYMESLSYILFARVLHIER